MRFAVAAILFALSVASSNAQTGSAPFAGVPGAGISNWSGFWVGAAVGGGVMPTYPNTLVGLPSSQQANVIGAGQAGFDIQYGNVVLGVTAAALTQSDRRSSLAFELGGRAGYLISPGALLFATGGLSTARNRLFLELPGILPAPSRVELASQQTYGFFVGAGLEYRIASAWSIAGEYIYADSGSVSFKGPFIANGFADRFEGTQALRMQSLRFSVRHRF